jgi:two-component sensor histidine kinase
MDTGERGLSNEKRLQALSETGLLDTPEEPAFDRLTRLVSRVLRTPVALVSLVTSDRQFFKSQQGLPEPWSTSRQTPLSHSFCQYVVIQHQTLVVPDAREDSVLCDNLAIRDLNVVAYLGVPIATPAGEVIGSLCAIDSKPRDWTEGDIGLMEDIAYAVMGEIALRLEINARRRSEDALELLNRELNHRIKNIFSLVGGLISVSARLNPGRKDFVSGLNRRISALAQAHDYIIPASDQSKAQPAATLAGLLEALLSPYPSDQIRIRDCGHPIGTKASTPIALIVHEMATNAIKYGALSRPQGRVEISCRKDGATLLLEWCERDGPALAGASTRRGFGSELSERSVAGLGGSISRDWSAVGLTVRVEIPLGRLAD